MKRVIGIDEVGRGCWAGPVVAAAVLLNQEVPGLDDSKVLSGSQREALNVALLSSNIQYGIGWVDPSTLDQIGLTAAVGLAMRRAFEQLRCEYDEVIIDGNYNFLMDVARTKTIIKADASVPAVSAASIIAKVARDTYMRHDVHTMFPYYGFDKHKGYGTKYHQEMLAIHGPTKMHRMSFKPLRQYAII